jgi:hypothetical protein
VGLILGDFDVDDSNHANARVFQLEPDNVGQLALDLLGDAAAAGVVSWHQD